MFRNILVAVDGSELSAKAASAAIELSALARAHLYALSVAQPFLPMAIEYQFAMQQDQLQQFDRLALESAKEHASAVVVQAQQRGVEATGLWLSSALIADEIIAQAQANECQLIVMASHGRKGLERLLMGSETLHVLTRTKLATLVIR